MLTVFLLLSEKECFNLISIKQSKSFNLTITREKLEHLNTYPRLHAPIKDSESSTFKPLHLNAVVENANDILTILKDERFVVKDVLFNGKLNDLPAVCKLLCQENATIPTQKTPGIKIHQEVKIEGCNDNMVFPKEVTIVPDPSDYVSANVVDSFNFIALLLCKQHRYTEALQFHAKILYMFQSYAPPGNMVMNLAFSYENIAQSFAAQGKEKEAAYYFEQANSMKSINLKPRF